MVAALIDFDALQQLQEQQQRAPRMLDIACGTGLLLQRVAARMPGIETHGLDASADMLEQARAILPRTTFAQVDLNAGNLACASFASCTFDLITCTNALHDIADPGTFFVGVKSLLAPGGQLVIEDFAPRHPLLFWAAFERFLQRVEMAHVHALTLPEVRAGCEAAGIRVLVERSFSISWFWHGWAIRATL